MAERHRPVARIEDVNGIQLHRRARRLRALAAGGGSEHEDGGRGGERYATHCHRAHCTVATPSILTTDATNGLQIAVKSCSVPWTQGGIASAATYTCSGTERTLTSGSVIGNRTLDNPAARVSAGSRRQAEFCVS